MNARAYNFTVTYKRLLTPKVIEIGFVSDEPMIFKAGQFISVVIPGAGPQGRDLRRAYSISSSPEELPLAICIREVEGGAGSNFLIELNEGDTFGGTAPYGHFIYKTTPEKHVVFMATGTGVGPIRSIVLSKDFLANRPKSAVCLFGASDESEILYEADIGHITGLCWVPCLSRPSQNWKGFRGRISQYFKQLTDPRLRNDTDYYLCGNGGMIREMKDYLTAHLGVDRTAIHQEVYFQPGPGVAQDLA